MYSPKPFIREITPESLLEYIQEELQEIARDRSETQELELRTVNREPSKPRAGMIVHADGTNWDPGNGEGAYVYQSGAWVWLGLQEADLGLSAYVTKAANGSDFANIATTRDNLGLEIGADVLAFDPQLFSNVPQQSKSANYTLVLTDGQKHIYHPSSDNNARTFTIPANSSVAFPVGTAVTFVNEINVVTLAITTDTLTWLPSGGTGSRSLAANGMATALKVASTKWVLSGVGLT